MNKILITGGEGFIGGNLIKLLNSRGIDFDVFTGDLNSKSDIEAFFINDKKYETIIHLAGLFSNDIDLLLSANVSALTNLVDFCSNRGLKRVIFSSSIAVYGETIGEYSVETAELKPNTKYGLTKMLGEQVLKFYKENFNIEYVILRFPNVYGPNNNKGIFYNFTKSIKETGKLTIDGDGNQKRNFLHVEDAANAIFLALNYPNSDVFNIAPAKVFTVNEIVALYKKICNFEVTYRPNPNNLINSALDSSKANKLLKFKPTHEDVSIEDLQ